MFTLVVLAVGAILTGLVGTVVEIRLYRSLKPGSERRKICWLLFLFYAVSGLAAGAVLLGVMVTYWRG